MTFLGVWVHIIYRLKTKNPTTLLFFRSPETSGFLESSQGRGRCVTDTLKPVHWIGETWRTLSSYYYHGYSVRPEGGSNYSSHDTSRIRYTESERPQTKHSIQSIMNSHKSCRGLCIIYGLFTITIIMTSQQHSSLTPVILILDLCYRYSTVRE